MATEPELGQFFHGNPTGDYGMPEYADALVDTLLSEIDRVYWNVNQKEWDRHVDPQLEGVVFNPYYWGEDEEEASKPNLAFKEAEQEVRWYKHPGRGTSCTHNYTPEQWVGWFEEALAIIRSNDKDFLQK